MPFDSSLGVCPRAAPLRDFGALCDATVYARWRRSLITAAAQHCGHCSAALPPALGHVSVQWRFDYSAHTQTYVRADYVCRRCDYMQHPALMLMAGYGSTWAACTAQRCGSTSLYAFVMLQQALDKACARVPTQLPLQLKCLPVPTVHPVSAYSDMSWCAEASYQTVILAQLRSPAAAVHIRNFLNLEQAAIPL